MRTLIRGLVMTLAILALPAVAGAQTMPATGPDLLHPASFVSDVETLTTPQVAAIVGGGLIGGVLAETFLEGGLLTVVGVILGAAVGDQWYDQHYWPFGGSSPLPK